MTISQVGRAIGILLFVAMGPLAFGNEDPQQERSSQASRVDADAVKPVEVELWVIGLRAADVANDGSADGETSAQADLMPAMETRAEVKTWIRALREQKRLIGTQHFLLGTVDGHQSRAQIGTDSPAITASTYTDYGQTNSVQFRPVGTLVEIRPQLRADGQILLTFTWNRSVVGESDVMIFKPKQQGDPLLSSEVENRIVSSATVVGNGGVAVACYADADTKSRDAFVILVSARRIGKD